MRYRLLLILSCLFTALVAQAQISGTATVCTGYTTTLTGTPAGGTWASSDTSIARVNSLGTVSGMSFGTAVITYYYSSTTQTRVVTVNQTPGAIAGSLAICNASATTLSSSPVGGSWSSSEPAVATIGAAGDVSALMPGITAIQYTLSTGCYRSAALTVNALPSNISGGNTVCVGGLINLTDTTSGGTWVSGSTSVATVGSSNGIVMGVAAGTVPISYRLTLTGCYKIQVVTVNPLPYVISGSTYVCTGSLETLTSGPSGGVWTSTNPSAGSINSTTGVVTGNAAGTTTISYTLPSTGCAVGRIETVYPMPGAITAASGLTVCPGSVITLSNTVAGGSWASSATSVATVGTSAGTSTAVSGVTAGTAIISYYTAPTCVSTVNVTVNPSPSAGTISGGTTVCTTTTLTLTSTVAGGTWSCPSSIVTVGSSSGVVSGVTAGTAVITYMANTICGTGVTMSPITVSVPPSAITGPTLMCAGTANTLVNGVPGGTWSTSSLAVATISGGGIITGVSGGTVFVTYAIAPSCQATTMVTVNPAPSPISGPDSVCVGSVIPLTDTASGGVWTSSAPAIATVGVVGVSTGMVTGIAPGTSIITYAMPSCNVYKIVAVNGLPTVNVTAAPNVCGAGFTMGATGGVSYSWAPTTGVSCPVCAGTSVVPMATTIYTVTGVDAIGCANTDTVSLSADRIYGTISFDSAMPTALDMKVWLVKYDSSTFTVTATDSLLTCLDGGNPYYQFNNQPAGYYYVKAKLLSSVPPGPGYMPTYGDSATNWAAADSVVHTANASDVQNITMRWVSSVPTGPGFIAGNVFSGAGKGTASAVPEVGMIILLEDAATGNVLTYTYTDASGAYSFSGIALGSYIIYPDEAGYHTTPSASVTLTATTPSATGVSFRKGTTSHTIYPYDYTGVGMTRPISGGVTIYPNPASGTVNIESSALKGEAQVTITDAIGRILLTTTQAVNDMSFKMDVSGLNNGIYILNIRCGSVDVTSKLVIANN